MHMPALWRLDLDVLELVLGRDLAFHKFANFRFDLAQLASGLITQIIVNLQNSLAQSRRSSLSFRR